MKKLSLTMLTTSLLTLSASSFAIVGDTSRQYEIDNQLQVLEDHKRDPSNNEQEAEEEKPRESSNHFTERD